jgi:CTP:molybdopterin cytidylyltransferase MocA
VLIQVFLLAAGRGRRALGPKAWLEHQGVPLLEKQLSFLLGRFKASDIRISIQSEWLDRARALSSGVQWVCADPDLPALASVQALSESQQRSAEWTFLYHVDMPVWEEALWRVLEDRALRAADADAVMPVFDGRGGHPVLLSAGVLLDLRGLDAGKDRLDHWLRSRSVLRVPVPFPCVLENWNTPRT